MSLVISRPSHFEFIETHHNKSEPQVVYFNMYFLIY